MFSLCSDLRVYEWAAPLHFKHVISPKVYFKEYTGKEKEAKCVSLEWETEDMVSKMEGVLLLQSQRGTDQVMVRACKSEGKSKSIWSEETVFRDIRHSVKYVA